ncbi:MULTISPECIES: hypothetical protein [unclassified Crossiella]|uniref:hypothetical protein n=1 Tax=unclassified Crossiella TaxID=2620835 RepID=UPI001FFFCBAD|nr:MULTISPECIES: hypothetical protein [unclassified Crossiella]MCK2237331.1 hypothetical protein [Crossiella sp. S99.2]MCK2250986.1 hypothetical protein [Crossiella sp. S99.1]
MAPRPAPVRWGLILLAVGLVGLGTALVVWLRPVLAGGSTQAQTREVSAVVITSTPCTGQAARDVVEIEVDGQKRQAKLDGCGHRQGETLKVALPVPVAAGDLVVLPAGAAPTGPGLEGRLSSVLLALACVAGALYGFLLRVRLPMPRRAKVQPVGQS